LIVFLIFLVVVVADDDDEDDEEETFIIIERERCDLFFLEAAAVVEKVAPATDADVMERAARVALGVVVNIVAKEKRW
jgi:glycerol-3-phosphate cytidylyltransferase-like family protein